MLPSLLAFRLVLSNEVMVFIVATLNCLNRSVQPCHSRACIEVIRRFFAYW